MSDENSDGADDYIAALLEQRLADMDDASVAALLARTRPPRLSPKDAAAQKLRDYLDQNTIRPKRKP